MRAFLQSLKDNELFQSLKLIAAFALIISASDFLPLIPKLMIICSVLMIISASSRITEISLNAKTKPLTPREWGLIKGAIRRSFRQSDTMKQVLKSARI